MILGIFAVGIIAAIGSIFLEKWSLSLYHKFNGINPTLFYILYIFIGIGFVEEFLKYLSVRFTALRHKECDEPFDIVLYMIIAALGFVTLENFLKFLRPDFLPSAKDALLISFIFTITSVLLHVIASGILGCFIAFGYYKHKFNLLIIILGIIFVTLLHGFYDFSIMKSAGAIKYISMAGLLVFMTALLWVLIYKIKKLPSICN